jgi:hypothetical protein
MITVTTAHSLELADLTNRGLRLQVIAYDSTAREVILASTARDSDGNDVYRDDEGQQYYGQAYDENGNPAHDEADMMILIDDEGL